MLLSNNSVPFLVMPTRLTSRSTNLIDHNYLFEGQCKTDCMTVRSGSFLEDITDYLPDYAVITKEKINKHKSRPMKRTSSDQNVNECAHLLQTAKIGLLLIIKLMSTPLIMFSEIIQSAFN